MHIKMITAEFRNIDDFSLDLGHVPDCDNWVQPSLTQKELEEVDRMVDELVQDYLL
jgi:hypothetical protein